MVINAFVLHRDAAAIDQKSLKTAIFYRNLANVHIYIIFSIPVTL
jgi:hypothetical protein